LLIHQSQILKSILKRSWESGFLAFEWTIQEYSCTWERVVLETVNEGF